MNKICFLLILFSGCNMARAQLDPLQNEIENSLETFEPEEDENSLLQLADDLENLQNQKIKINIATPKDLEQIPQLDIFQIHNLLEYRRKTGYLLSAFELRAVKGFDQEKIEDILPFLDFSLEPEQFHFPNRKTIKYSRNELIIRDKFNLQNRKGFEVDSGGYLGNPHSFMARYKFNFMQKIGAAIHLQQDAGEPILNSSKVPGIDFTSFTFFVKDLHFVNTLVIGDFNYEFGQGLNLWSGIGFGKSPNVSQIQRFSRGIIPYSGGEENRFFRGVASDFKLGNFRFLSFYSKRKLDANLEENENGDFEISSFPSSGLHRTEKEMENKNAADLEVFNGSLLYRGNQYSLGINHGFYFLNHPIQTKDRLYQKFDLQAQKWQSSSFSGKFQIKNFSLFTEISALDFSSYAGLLGLQIKPDDALKISILHRNFNKQYQAFYSAPFAEKGSSGEKGYYFGLDWTFNAIFNWQSYFDFYQFTWSTFQSDFPSSGQDLMNQLEIKLSSNFNMYLRFRHRTRDENQNSDAAFVTNIRQSKSNFRIQLNYQVNESMDINNRLEISQNSEDKNRGIFAYQDFKYTFPKRRLQLVIRYSIFDISDFENRIYSYENDLSQSFSVPANYGKGRRYYILLKWKIKDNWAFEIKFAKTIFSDRNEISSGLNLIEGNEISELKTQLKIRL